MTILKMVCVIHSGKINTFTGLIHVKVSGDANRPIGQVPTNSKIDATSYLAFPNSEKSKQDVYHCCQIVAELAVQATTRIRSIILTAILERRKP